MSNSERQPQPGDRVRVTPKPFEGQVDSVSDDRVFLKEDDGEVRYFNPSFCTVEILEPAEDPVPDEAWEAAAAVFTAAGRGFDDVARDAIRAAFTSAPGTPEPRPVPLHKAADPSVPALHTGLREHCTRPSCLPREPRVFHSDGPEPAPDVVALRDNGASSIPYLLRNGSYWVWSTSLDVKDAKSDPRRWEHLGERTELVEVQS